MKRTARWWGRVALLSLVAWQAEARVPGAPARTASASAPRAASTEPGTTEPAATQPGTTEPGTTALATTEPAASAPAASAPAATEPAATGPAATEPAAAPVPAPSAPYSLPWYLRPAALANVLLSDTVVALYGNANGGGSTGVSFLLGGYKLRPNLGLVARLGVVGNAAPPAAPGTAAPGAGYSFVNPALGVLWAPRVHPDWKLVIALLGALPVGMGGGNPPRPEDPTDPAQRAFLLARATSASGVLARSAMDNAMFAVNDAVIFPGLDLAFVRWGLTIQLEATVLFLIRARGELSQPDSFKLNLTTGLHLGYFITPWLSVGAELHYQRWLVPPRAVAAATTAAAWAGVSQASASIGPRLHFKLGSLWLRPGLSYTRGFDAPMASAGYHVVQLHLPLVF